MTEKTIISLQVTGDRKERWEKAVDESPETGTLSGFIRGAVEARIEGRTNGQNGSAGNSEALNEILEAIQGTNSRLGDLEGSVSTVENLVRGDPETEELADRIFGILPTEDQLAPLQFKRQGGKTVVLEPDVDSWEGAENEVPVGEIQDSRLAESGHILGLADVVGESPYDTEEALEELIEETYVVGTTEQNGETLYFREE